jgi:hypothetical protein
MEWVKMSLPTQIEGDKAQYVLMWWDDRQKRGFFEKGGHITAATQIMGVTDYHSWCEYVMGTAAVYINEGYVFVR